MQTTFKNCNRKEFAVYDDGNYLCRIRVENWGYIFLDFTDKKVIKEIMNQLYANADVPRLDIFACHHYDVEACVYRGKKIMNADDSYFGRIFRFITGV